MRVSCVQSTVIFLSEFTYKQNLAQMKCKVAFQPLPQKSPPTHVYHCMPLIMTDTIVRCKQVSFDNDASNFKESAGI